LMDAVDNEIPEPIRLIDKPFLMPVEDVFSITGRGTVATGRIERGIVKVGESVDIVGMMRPGEKPLTSTVTGVEMFRKSQSLGYYSLLYLCQAIVKIQQPERVNISVITNSAYDVSGTEISKPEKSTILALCKVVSQEQQNISRVWRRKRCHE